MQKSCYWRNGVDYVILIEIWQESNQNIGDLSEIIEKYCLHLHITTELMGMVHIPVEGRFTTLAKRAIVMM